MNHFYTKGERIDSKCKECAKKIRVDRYKRKKKASKARMKKGRLMVINSVRFVESLESAGLKKRSVCKTVDSILEDHIFNVISGAYSKDGKDAA